MNTFRPVCYFFGEKGDAKHDIPGELGRKI